MVIDDNVKDQIRACVELAEACPVDMTTLEERFKDPTKREHHRAQMQRQTITIPIAFDVTFSIEHGQPFGPARHLSMSVGVQGRLPNPIALWLIAKEFGFWGNEITQCQHVWPETLSDGRTAINILQALKPEQVKP